MSAESNDETPLLESGTPDKKDSEKKHEGRGRLDPAIFNLSGGILKEERRGSTWSTIDDILARLMASQPSGSRVSKHVDRNLDYLHTSLQLDMIRMVAEGIQPTPEGKESDDEEVARDRIVKSLRGSVEYSNPHHISD